MCVPARGGARPGQRRTEMGSEVSGGVYGVNSVPLSTARVELQALVGGFRQVAYTDGSGHFMVAGVPPGNYSVDVRAAGYAPSFQSLVVGSFPVVGLRFVLSPARGASRGTPKGKKSYTVSVRQLKIPEKARKEYAKGVQSKARGKIDDAIRHWEKSIRIYPPFAESYMQLSQVYADRGEFDPALADAKRAIKIDGKNGEAYTYLGYVYLKEKDLGNAEKAFASAVQLSDTEWFAQFWLGRLLLSRNKVQRAYPHLLRANQLKPDKPAPYLLLYNDLVKLGRREDALAEIDAFLARFPQNPMAPKAREKREALAKGLGEKKP